MMKSCIKCGERKSLEEFHAHATRDGRRSDCKVCNRKRMKAYNRRNKETLKRKSAVFRSANRERVLQQKRDYWARHNERLNREGREHYHGNREMYLMRVVGNRLGIPEDLAAALYQLDCAICGALQHSTEKRHAIDHDHAVTGPASVRGVLCMYCNTALGVHEKGEKRRGYTDNPKWMASAQNYLNTYEAQLRAI